MAENARDPAADPAEIARRDLLAAAAIPSYLADASRPGAPLTYANPALLALTGRSEAELLGQGIGSLAMQPREDMPDGDFLARRADGASFWASLTTAELPGTGLRLGHVLDASRRRDAEDALALSRQREALGLLTNSVAHEFNNFLQILVGYIDGLRRRLGDSPEPFVQRAVVRATDAAERATVLTRQLLAFSRRIAPDVRPVDLDALVAGFAERLRPILPPGVRLEVQGTPDLPKALSNPTQVELALGHIVANACEAMAGSGTITLATCRIESGDRTAMGSPSGSVGLVVTDTGPGMSPEMAARALAPFATSREAGRGVGLAIVHGLMKRQNGTVALDSRPGEGTGVRLIFPAAQAERMHHSSIRPD
ncbi:MULTISPECIES: ATP-binding protein [Methylobacterium]|uniref:histidine kinase n=1 Tax=Methylobacterium jeotgali TaxID=381630 RepID=A0ABQ4SZT9_9HYPH|nr:hypothetical protein AwMethylo_03180 [Methylobacterium sp.]GJE07176.1 Blue-light-activated protein [Methylobacterium jeotgali]